MCVKHAFSTATTDFHPLRVGDRKGCMVTLVPSSPKPAPGSEVPVALVCAAGACGLPLPG